MKSILHKLVRKFIKIYNDKEEKEICSMLGYCGENVRIGKPIMIGHPENIFIGEGTTIMDMARLQAYPELMKDNPTIKIGKCCFMGYRLCLLAGADIIIGDYVLMASDITLCSHNHGMNPLDSKVYMEQKLTANKIVIGDNCWIGDKVIILAGINVGMGSIIGAGSVVTHDVPRYSMVVGNPARVIKVYNFETKRWEKNE